VTHSTILNIYKHVTTHCQCSKNKEED